MFLNILVVSCLLWNINWANVCPFPGIPANGYGNVIRNGVSDQTITWKPHSYFNPGDQVDYYCRKDWKKPQHVNRSLFCQEDGTWTGNTIGWRGGLPRCDVRLNVSEWQRTGYKVELRNGVNVSTEWTLWSLHGKEYHISEVIVTTGSSNIRDLQLRSANGSYEKCNTSGKIFNCDHVKFSSVAIYIIFNRTLSDDYVKSLSAIALTGDYCGHPPVPLNASFTLSDNNRTVLYQFVDKNQVTERRTCDPVTGTWNPTNTVNDSRPAAVASGIAVALIVVIVITILIMKNKFCFRPKQPTASAAPVATSNNLSPIYDHLADCLSDDAPERIYSDIDAERTYDEHVYSELGTASPCDAQDVYSSIEEGGTAEDIYSSLNDVSVPPVYAEVSKKTDAYAVVDKSQKKPRPEQHVHAINDVPVPPCDKVCTESNCSSYLYSVVDKSNCSNCN